MNGITKETFKECDTDSKLDILFDYIQDIHNEQATRPAECEARFKALENQKPFNTAVSAIMGIVGGAAAVFAKLKIWG